MNIIKTILIIVGAVRLIQGSYKDGAILLVVGLVI
jgi:hypothetical protein